MRPDAKLHSLQYLRALAALLVVVHHTREQNDALKALFTSPFGSAGVDIFFVISGFLMLQISDRTKSRLSFFLERFLRVAPLYYVFTTLFLVLLILLPHVFDKAVLSLPQYAASLAFLPFMAFDGRIRPLISIGWTLNYEIYFYVLMALFSVYGTRVKLLGVTASLLLIMLVATILSPVWPLLAFYSNPLVLEFVMGMLIAAMFQSRQNLGRSVPALSLTLGIGLFVFTTLLIPVQPDWRFVMFGIPAALIVFGSIGLEKSRSITIKTEAFQRGAKGLERIGDASYSLYLSHIFTLGGVTLVWRMLHLPLQGVTALLTFAATSVVACIVAALIIHRVLEKPLLRVSRRGLALLFNKPARP